MSARRTVFVIGLLCVSGGAYFSYVLSLRPVKLSFIASHTDANVGSVFVKPCVERDGHFIGMPHYRRERDSPKIVQELPGWIPILDESITCMLRSEKNATRYAFLVRLGTPFPGYEPFDEETRVFWMSPAEFADAVSDEEIRLPEYKDLPVIDLKAVGMQ